MLIKFMEIKCWLKIIEVGVVKNWCGYSGYRALKLAVSHKRVNGINSFLVWWYNSGKLEVTLIIFGWSWSKMALKFAVLEEWIGEMSWIYACWHKFMKAKSYFNNYWVGMVINGWGLSDHGTLKSFVSYKWFNELSRLIEWFLHADSDRTMFGLAANLLYIFDI